jgi:hypothetical protein
MSDQLVLYGSSHSQFTYKVALMLRTTSLVWRCTSSGTSFHCVSATNRASASICLPVPASSPCDVH